MTDDPGTDPHALSYLMVGRFLQHYSLLEAEINGCIAAGLRLDPTQAAIVTANIQMRDKIHIIKSLVSSALMTADKIEEAVRTINQFAEFSLLRNMMAHTFFRTNDSGDAVVFNFIKARGKVEISDTVWSTEEFAKQDVKNWEFIRFFENLKDQLSRADLVRALLHARTEPAGRLFGLEISNTPLPLSQETLSSDPIEANPDTNGQTRAGDRE